MRLQCKSSSKSKVAASRKKLKLKPHLKLLSQTPLQLLLMMKMSRCDWP